MAKQSSKFKELLKEVAGGVVDMPATNGQGGLGYTERSDQERYGFEFDPDGMPHNNKPNNKSAFENKKNETTNSVVIYEDSESSITLRRNTPQEFEVVLREGSQENVFEIDREAASAIKQLFS